MNKLYCAVYLLKKLNMRCCVTILVIVLFVTILTCIKVSKFYKSTTTKLSAYQEILKQQNLWLLKRDSISERFKDMLDKMNEADNQRQDLSLVSMLENSIADLNCQYELSDEVKSNYDGFTVSKVEVNFYSVDLETFIQFNNKISSKITDISDVHIHVRDREKLNIKCFVESISLVQL